MTPRPLDLLDLPTLYRYRSEAANLDSTRMLTRGNPLGAAGFISYFNPARHLYTGVSQENGETLVGGVTQSNGDTFARLVYIAPVSQLAHPAFPGLIEHLTAEAGRWGAFHVLAETDENSQAFLPLRAAGFSVYAWQRIWDVSHITPQDGAGVWSRVESANLPAVQSLYHQIVPPLLHPVEPTPKRASGLFCSEGARCYVHIAYGMYGIVLTPLIHPDAADVAQKLTSLLNELPERRGRPVYLCVRSYQAWLEPALQDLGGKAAPRQAVMVKHLARVIKEEQAVRAVQPAGVGALREPSHVSQAELTEKYNLGK
jgi:hypothetical protein